MYYVYMYVYMWVLWCITYSYATTGVNIYLSSIETQVTIASNSTVANIDSVNYFDPFLNFQTSQPTQGTTTTSAISVLLPSINPRNIGSACPGKEDVEICLRLANLTPVDWRYKTCIDGIFWEEHADLEKNGKCVAAVFFRLSPAQSWRYGGPRHPKSAEKRPPKAKSKCCNLQVAIYQPSFYFSSLHLFIITFTSRATPGPLYPMVSKYGLEPPWPHSVSRRPNVSRSKGSKGFHHRWDPSFPTNGWSPRIPRKRFRWIFCWKKCCEILERCKK